MNASNRPIARSATASAKVISATAEEELLSSAQIFLRAVSLLAEEANLQPAAAPVQLPKPAEDGLLTIAQAASTLDVCRQTIHNWVRSGDLKAYKLRSRTYFKKAELLSALRLKMRPDGFRKNARRSFTDSKPKVAIGGAGVC